MKTELKYIAKTVNIVSEVNPSIHGCNNWGVTTQEEATNEVKVLG